MSRLRPSKDQIFNAAAELLDPGERARYLVEVCADDPELRSEIESLLAHDLTDGNFLKPPGRAFASTTAQPSLSEQPGAAIGPYKLLQQIGEGGMGVVFMAEQVRPVERKVALKIIKPGMDSRQVIARFEAERQALALMDHPNIARVLDAGTTDSGRPYFVMELVRGVPITEYCDEHQLTARERLALFLPICQAVQHAHQKGVIHRDLKPTNILVVEYDHEPAAKIIDFGVAKAISQRLTEKTMFTEFGQVMGTIDYMSPEQAKLNQLDVDTRSDIYSLGVLLYELLTGETPLDRQKLRSAAFDEMLRHVREEEPLRPSARLSSAQTAAMVATNRRSEPKRLANLVRGELDWIVMKCLEKDRNRRYETASDLAADVDHYLRQEPVRACPPTIRYRVQKFASRNKTPLAIGASALLLLATLTAGVLWNLWDASARRAVLKSQVTLALADTVAMQVRGDWPGALNAAKRGAAIVAGNQAGKDLAQQVQERVVDLEMALTLERIHSGFLGDRYQAGVRLGTPADLSGAYATAFRNYGIDVLAPDKPDVEAALSSRSIVQELAAAIDHWALVQRQANKTSLANRLSQIARSIDADPWRNRLRDVMAQPGPNRDTDSNSSGDPRKKAILELAQVAPIDALPPSTVAQLADVLWIATGSTGPSAQALDVLKRAQRNHPDDFRINFLLAQLYWRWDMVDEQIRYFTAATALRPGEPGAWIQLGEALQHARRWDESIAVLRRVIEIRAARGDRDASVDRFLLGRALRFAGRPEESADQLRSAIRLAPRFGEAHLELGTTLAAMNQTEDAVQEYSQAFDLGFDSHWNWRAGFLEIGRREEVFRRLTELRPADSRSLWAIRGQYLVLASDWKRATEAYDEVVQEQSWPSESGQPTELPYEYACLLLCAGDEAGYSKFAQDLVKRAGDDERSYAQFVLARTCAVSPQMIAPAQRVVSWAESHAEENPSAWSFHVASLAQYRAGNYEESVRLARESNNWWWHAAARAPNWLVLAMAQQRLGQTAQAQAALREAERLGDHATDVDPLGNGVLALASPDWLEYVILRREARETLTSNSIEAATSTSGLTSTPALPPDNSDATPPAD